MDALPSLAISIKTVVVPTDFSVLSQKAFPYARALLSRGGKVVLVSVLHPRALPDGEFEVGPWTEESRARHLQFVAERREDLEILRQRLGSDIEVEAILEFGDDVPQSVCRMAKDRAADIICMSSHGYTGFRAGILGSVAQSVLAQSPCPVMLVRDVS